MVNTQVSPMYQTVFFSQVNSKLNNPNQFNQVTELLNNISLISQNMLVHLQQKDKWRAEAKRQLEELEQLY